MVVEKILFCHASADWSIADVANGYRRAFGRVPGLAIEDFKYTHVLQAMAKLFEGREDTSNVQELMYQASRQIALEALSYQPDFVVVMAGIGFHPIGLELLRRAGFPIAVVYTESPYDHLHEVYFASWCAVVATNERLSAKAAGWLHLPAAFDPDLHTPEPGPARAGMLPNVPHHDVVVVGTGWAERAGRLAEIDWTGIDLGIYGMWPQLAGPEEGLDVSASSGLIVTEKVAVRLRPHFRAGVTDNPKTAELYRRARLAINDHRAAPTAGPILGAASLGPRCYEVLAVGGALLLTDYREDVEELLGARWREFIFTGSTDLERRIRELLADEPQRRELVAYGRARVAGETFDARVATLLAAMAGITEASGAPPLAPAACLSRTAGGADA